MALLPIDLPPGLYKNGTELDASGRWSDSNLVRWHDSVLKPIGGWRVRTNYGFFDPIRGLVSWKSNNGSRYMACGTYQHLFAIVPAGTVYDITPAPSSPSFTSGRIDASGMTGFGSGYFGMGVFGEPPLNTSTTLLDATSWSLSPWGENLIASNPDDGRVYEWTLNTSNPASLLTNAPTGVKTIIVSDQRFLFCFQARKVYWSDQESNNVFTSSATNQAGDINLETQGTIKCAEKIRGGIIILTDQDAHACTYVGLPFVHSIQRVGSSCGIYSQLASASVDVGVVWMGPGGFHLYAGGRVQELKSEVTDAVYAELSETQTSKISAVANAKYNEVIWFYPADGLENSKYVSWNFANNTWAIGSVGRTCGIDAGVMEFPIYATAKNHTYNVARQRFSFTGQTHSHNNADLPATTAFNVGNKVVQYHDFLRLPIGDSETPSFRTWYDSSEHQYLLDTTEEGVQLSYFQNLLKPVSGTTQYESYTFSPQKLKVWLRNLDISIADNIWVYRLEITGLDGNGVAQVETIEINSNLTLQDYNSTYRSGWILTEKVWTKITQNGLKVTRPGAIVGGGQFEARRDWGSSTASTAEKFYLGLSLNVKYTTALSMSQCRAYGEIKNSFAGPLHSGADVQKVMDIEIQQGTFLDGVWVSFQDSSFHAISTQDNTKQLNTKDKLVLNPNEYMLQEHEVGEERDSLEPFAETGPIQIGNGDNVMHVNQVIPDEKTAGQVSVEFTTAFYPNGSESTHGPYTLASPTSVRFQGREVKMKIKNVSGDWRVGQFRINAVAGGKR